MSRKSGLLLVLIVAVASWSGPLVRLAHPAPALGIAFWRNAVGAAVMVPLALLFARSELAGTTRRDRVAMALSGVLLAIHFGTWIASVNMTTVAASVLLVTSEPIFVALLSGLIGEPATRRGWMGIFLALAGVALIGGGDASQLGHLRGDALAVAGAAAAAGYFMIGRRVRSRVGVLPYVAVVYTVSALALLGAAFAAGTRLGGYSAPSWWAIAAIAAGPQLIGHTTSNFLLGSLEAVKVSVAMIAEAAGSTLIAAWLFGEIPHLWVIPGSVALLGGIALTLGSRRDEALVPS